MASWSRWTDDPPAGASVHAAGPAGPVGFTELELLKLAGGGADQGVAQLDRRRAFVVGHPAPAVLDEIALGGRGARPEDDEGLDRLPPLLVGYADHRDLRHRGVLKQAILDLDGRDVLAAGDDHVLLAVADGDVRPLPIAAVTGVEPAIHDGRGGFLGLVPVAFEDVIGAGEHLTLSVHVDADADRGHARARESPRPLPGIEPVPLRRRAVDGEKRRGLREPVD